jgi:ribosomal protein L11 methyltransferase
MHALRVVVPAVEEETATVVLWDAGTEGVEVRTAGPDTVELVAYFPAPVETSIVSAALPGASVDAVDVPDVDWVTRFREGFGAFDAGGFRIVPAWAQPTSATPWTLVVDPGRAFGTGTHETTRLCLESIENLASRRRLGRTLDLGAGTGLLAIAASRLGAFPVVASDVDPEATAACASHARLNAAPLAVVRADGGRGLRLGTFDVVVANLMALFLVDRAPEVCALVAPGGTLVLSGLLADDVPEVRAVYDPLCALAADRRLGEWAALEYEVPAR